MTLYSRPKPEAWRISLHGGHSSAYCDHAFSTLREIVESAIAAGYHTFGITEHAPRVEPERLYDEERALGWDVAHLDRLFREYAAELRKLSAEYAGAISILRGFEAEVVPEDAYVEVMRSYLDELRFDYMVGSVHWVNGHIIDYKREHFDSAMALSGSLEQLAVAYYQALQEMILQLRPKVIGHFDLIRKNAPDEESVSTAAVRKAALQALEAARHTGAILDVNTAGYRKGLGRPYPAPWIIRAAREMGIGLCFGDDSHRSTEVGVGIEDAREYLIGLGVTHLRGLRRRGEEMEEVELPLR